MMHLSRAVQCQVTLRTIQDGARIATPITIPHHELSTPHLVVITGFTLRWWEEGTIHRQLQDATGTQYDVRRWVIQVLHKLEQCRRSLSPLRD